MSKLENDYQAYLIKKILKIFPGSIVLKNDPTYLQGIPDLSIFYGNKYAMLEVKKSEFERHQPNQNYYVDYFNNISFAAFIFPENEDSVLNALISFLQNQ